MEWSVVVEKLDPDFAFDESLDQRRFETRMQSMLGGLIEISHFSRSETQSSCPLYMGNSSNISPEDTFKVHCSASFRGCRARLVHRTLKTSFEQHAKISQLTKTVIEPVFMHDLELEVRKLMVHQAQAEFPVDALDIARGFRPKYNSMDPNEFYCYLQRFRLPKHWRYQLQYLFRCMGSLLRSKQNSPQLAPSVLDIFKVPMARLHCISNCMLGCGEDLPEEDGEFRFRAHTWHLHYLAHHSLWYALNLGLLEQEYNLEPEARDDLLQSVMNCTRGYSQEVGAHINAAIGSMDALLEDVKLKTYHVALYLLFPATEQP